MFTVENTLEKGWESSKISRRVYVCNGLIVDGCQRNEISILQMSETCTRSPAKTEVKSNFYNKKKVRRQIQALYALYVARGKNPYFFMKIRVFFFLFLLSKESFSFVFFVCARFEKRKDFTLTVPASLPTQLL